MDTHPHWRAAPAIYSASAPAQEQRQRSEGDECAKDASMNQYATGLLATVFAVCAHAGSAQAETGPIDEIRFQAMDHDTGLVGSSKEDGADLGVELFSHPISQLSLVGSPRVVAGVLLNTAGQTNQAYLGLSSQWTFAHGVMHPDDSFFLEGTVGAAYHDGKIDVRDTPENDDWKSHGSHVLFRTGFGVGYHFDERWSLTMTFAHISNADLAHPNQGSNDIGLALGVKL